MPIERNIVEEDANYSDNDFKVRLSAAHEGAMKKKMMKWLYFMLIRVLNC
jgi:hypothetical protein